MTGINFFLGELTAKRLDLLRELVPAATRVAVLVNPVGAANSETTVRDVEAAARAMGLQTQVFNASTSTEINAAFATFVRERPDALFVGADPFFTNRRVQLANLASHHSIPATYAVREFAEAGGLMSYGTNIVDAWRQIGVYTGRILKGAKPADLPVVQANKFELIINAETARMLGLTVPPSLLSTRRRGDRVMTRREFITLLGGAQRRGRSRRERSSRRCRYVASGYCFPHPQTTRNFRPGLVPSCRPWDYQVGSLAAMCGSTPAGLEPMPMRSATTLRNWLRSHRT